MNNINREQLGHWVAVSIAVLTVLAGCGGSTTQTTSTATLKIGFIADLAGQYLALGFPAYNGTQVMVQMINDAGGVSAGGKKYKLALDVCQANSDPTQAVACARQLIKEHGVRVILGAIGNEGPPVAAFADSNNAIYIASGSATAAHMSEYHTVFDTIADTNIRVQLAVQGLKKGFPNAKSVSFLVNNEATSAILPKITAAAESSGLTVKSTDQYDSKTLDLTPQMSKIKAAGPDVLFLGWTPEEIAPAVKANQAIQAVGNVYGWAPGSCGTLRSEIGSVRYVGNQLAGVDLNNPTTAMAKDFIARYQAFIKTDAAAQNPANSQNLTAPLFFADSLWPLRQAMASAKSTTDAKAITAQLEKVRVESVTGPGYGFTSTHLTAIGDVHCTVNGDGPGVQSTFYLPPPK